MRMTLFAKVFITLVIAGVLGYVAWHHGLSGHHDHGTQAILPPSPARQAAHDHDHDHDHAATHQAAGGRPGGGPTRIVVGTADLSSPLAGVVANDGVSPGPRSLFSQQGLRVEFRRIRDDAERRAAFEHGELDVLLTPVDALAKLAPEYPAGGPPRTAEPAAFLMTRWSRGDLGLVAAPSVHSIEDLQDARIAVMRHGTAHFFLLMLLEDANLSAAAVERVRSRLVYATRAPYASEIFLRGEADAAVTFEPYLVPAMAGGKGHLLLSTATASQLVGEVLVAPTRFLTEQEPALIRFTRVWLQGVALLKRDPQAAALALSKAAGTTAEAAQTALSHSHFAAFADNRDFFGLEREDGLYVTIFEHATRLWQREGLIKKPAAAARTRWLHALEALREEHLGEKVVEEYTFRKAPGKDATPLLSKTVSIYFPSGSAELDPNAQKIVAGFVEEIAELGNTFVRVEGHTDSVGAPARNRELSQRRAQAVVNYLVSRHGFAKERFQAEGHGADKPVESNQTQAGRDLNRRTDFRIISNE